MKKFQFLILFSAVALFASAQENNFLLYSFKGNVSVVENGVESKAKVGKSLNSKATVKVPAGGMATLICNEAAMFTLAKAGNYPMTKVKDSCAVSTSSVSANYVRYVWNQMTKSSGSAGSNRKAYMNTVGAVSRGINSVWIDPRYDTINYASGEFPLSWKCYSEAKEFEFALYMPDNLATPFYKKDVNKLKIQISEFIGKLKPGTQYRWTSSAKEEDENDNLPVFNYVTKATFDELLAKIKAQGASFEAPAEQAYRIGFMLEDARYLAEAYQYYTKATTLAPDNALYRSTLMSFKKDYEIK